MKKKLVLSKTKTDTYKKKIKLLKSQKPMQKKYLAQTMPAANKSPTTSVSKLKGKEISQAQSYKNMSNILVMLSSSK